MGAIKGVILRLCPGAQVVDLTHGVPPFAVDAGALLWWGAAREFPGPTVHMAVVDPGVGGPRRAIAARAAGSLWVAPDNGLFGHVLAEAGVERAVVLARPPGASATFEGRDVFAPAAARLAAGAQLEDLGEPVDPAGLVRLDASPRVVWIDGFGNLVTNLRPPVGPLAVGSTRVEAVARTYSEAPPGAPFVYLGSFGFLEIGVWQGAAAALIGAGAGTEVRRL